MRKMYFNPRTHPTKVNHYSRKWMFILFYFHIRILDSVGCTVWQNGWHSVMEGKYLAVYHGTGSLSPRILHSGPFQHLMLLDALTVFSLTPPFFILRILSVSIKIGMALDPRTADQTTPLVCFFFSLSGSAVGSWQDFQVFTAFSVVWV